MKQNKMHIKIEMNVSYKIKNETFKSNFKREKYICRIHVMFLDKIIKHWKKYI